MEDDAQINKKTDLSFFNCFGLFAIILDITSSIFERVGPFIYDFFKVDHSLKFMRMKIIIIFFILFKFLSKVIDNESLVFYFLFFFMITVYFFIFHFKIFLKWTAYMIFILFFLFCQKKEGIFFSKDSFE
jgi:hypothetical protein